MNSKQYSFAHLCFVHTHRHTTTPRKAMKGLSSQFTVCVCKQCKLSMGFIFFYTLYPKLHLI